MLHNLFESITFPRDSLRRRFVLFALAPIRKMRFFLSETASLHSRRFLPGTAEDGTTEMVGAATERVCLGTL